MGGPSLAFVAGRLEPASHPSAHRDLDLAVIDAFGWEAAILGDVRERNRRLYELNARIAAGDARYKPL